ncbi:MAG: hypothetical protein V1875_03945 [Candidatus Altiarchaeota archaeon]
MAGKNKFIAAFILCVLLAGMSSAFSFGDLIDYIMSLFGGGDGDDSEPQGIVCKPPYMTVGNACCLDRDQNGICDRDEATTTTRPTPTTTTSRVTTTAPRASTTLAQETTSSTQATTTTVKSGCKTNADCGQPVEERLCKDGDVWLKKTIQMCTKPGTPDSQCIAKVTASKAETCGELYCVNAQCVTEEEMEGGSTTASTIAGSSTTQPGQTTTTQAPAANPVCGDGRLSWSGAGGTEECDGSNYPCPSGLSCVNCKCSGCGDGRLQAGEQCENNNRISRVNGQPLWSGQATQCAGEYEVCDSSCRCVSSVQCSGDLYSSADCSGGCNSACETCSRYQQTPCYECKKDCTKLGQGWGDSTKCSSCDSKHFECKEHDTCDGCYHCVETCPASSGYFRFAGCDATCDSRLCAKVGSGQYADCYKCSAARCGDGIVTHGEECEKDADCGNAKCVGCLCQFDCPGFCGGQGANGYAVTAGPATEDACKANAAAQGNALNANCRATCWASAFSSYSTPRGVQTCCCTDADWKPCLNCPNQNQALIDCDTPLAQCKAGL